MKLDMDLERRLELLMSLAADDREGRPESQGAGPRSLPPRLRNAAAPGIGALRPLNLRSVRAGKLGQKTLLRVLMTNACSFNCHYCPMRRDRNLPRTLLKPEELVRIFLEARRRGWCEGLFITTGIPGRPVTVMDNLIQVLELLRFRHRYDGYIHVKIVPGAQTAQIERVTLLANRVSVNLETPCGDTLTRIAPEKHFDTTLVTLQRARAQVTHARAEERDGRPRDMRQPGGTAGMTTQFVVGATADTDRTIISRVTELYAGGGIAHTHFSAFRPIRDTPMEDVRTTPALREQRLYQTDYLLRQYGFTRDDIVFDKDGNLPLAFDPKIAWALSHPEQFPLEVRTASYEALLKVPGIGPVAARRIVHTRRTTVFRGLADLHRLGVVTARAAGFLMLGGRRLQSVRWTEQLNFWAPEDEAGAYQTVYNVSPGTFR